MEYKFPEQCFFCQSRIGSEHCLLPFELVNVYTAPNDALSAITDITEIHMHCGIPALKANFELIQWVRMRPTANEISEYSRSVRSRTSEWFESQQGKDETTEQRVAKYVEASSQTQSPTKELETTSWSDEVQESETYASKAKAKEDKDHIDLIPEHLKEHRAVEVSEDNETTGGTHLTKESDGESDRNKVEQVKMISKDEEIHLAYDLMLAAKAAYKLYSLKRLMVKTGQLIEHLITEIELRNTFGNSYRPSLNTTLDGTKSISKEIVGRHNEEIIRQWESGKNVNAHRFCILNFKAFQASKIGVEGNHLLDDLTRYYGIAKENLSKRERDYERVQNLIKFEFERQNELEIDSWIKTRVRYLELKDSNTKKSMQNQEVHETKEQKREPYPAIDERLSDHINTHLQLFVNAAIRRANGDVPTMKDETKVETFIVKLATEFLKRNKGWQNENSFSSPAHLTKLETSIGMRSPPMEAFMTFTILMDALNEFRKSFKHKYGK